MSRNGILILDAKSAYSAIQKDFITTPPLFIVVGMVPLDFTEYKKLVKGLGIFSPSD